MEKSIQTKFLRLSTGHSGARRNIMGHNIENGHHGWIVCKLWIYEKVMNKMLFLVCQDDMHSRLAYWWR
jgi:hypothetical protein